MIEIKNIQFGYQKNQTLFNSLNLNLELGKIYGLLGKNGEGKTTLLKLISGLVYPQKGECIALGHQPMSRKIEFLKQLFIVPEEFQLPDISIKTFLNLYAGYYPNFSTDMFYEILKDFDVDINNKFSSISFGQKKKVFLGFAFATQTPILLLDEPTNGLDIPAKGAFRKWISKIISDSKIIIISTHQVRDLHSLIDNILILNNNKICLNHNIEEISSKLRFGKIPLDISEANILYKESIMGISSGIYLDKQNNETLIDLEILFNGVISNSNLINKHLN